MSKRKSTQAGQFLTYAALVSEIFGKPMKMDAERRVRLADERGRKDGCAFPDERNNGGLTHAKKLAMVRASFRERTPR